MKATERDIREAHRARLRVWDLAAQADHEDEVVERALQPQPPVLHEHAHNEMGMCVECDAAAALLRLEGE